MAASASAAAPRKRIRRKPADAEREILAAAEAFLQSTDFRDLTVDGVMAATGMKRSAFYNYFADRADPAASTGHRGGDDAGDQPVAGAVERSHSRASRRA